MHVYVIEYLKDDGGGGAMRATHREKAWSAADALTQFYCNIGQKLNAPWPATADRFFKGAEKIYPESEGQSHDV